MAEILSAAGVKSGSLYYFFKSKEALLLAVLDRYVELLQPAVIEPAFARTRDPIGRIFAVLDGYRRMLLETGFKQGCPIGNLALEMSDKSEAVREKIALNFDNWTGAVRQCLLDADDALAADVDRDRLATFVLTVMEGAVMVARIRRSIAPYEQAIAILRTYFERIASTTCTLDK